MRVSSLIALGCLVILAILAVLFRGFIFDKIDGYYQWSSGFTPAKTPVEAMEKFREAIRQRRYKWAATYCTKDYADLLIKSNEPAGCVGAQIDLIDTYMKNKGLQKDRAVILLHNLDPFPTNFKVVGAP